MIHYLVRQISSIETSSKRRNDFDWAILFISIFHTDFANAKIFNFDEEKLSFFIT